MAAAKPLCCVCLPASGCYLAVNFYLGHQNGLSAELTVTENLCFAKQLGGGSDVQTALQAWELTTVEHHPVRYLSQGQRRRLALARVWLGQRILWLLDEPCASLDRAGEQLFLVRLATHLEAGGMAVVATHHALVVAAEALQRIDMNTLSSTPSQDILTAC
jgi:heme exporter protein A